MAVPCPQFLLVIMMLLFQDQVLCKRYDLLPGSNISPDDKKLPQVRHNRGNLTSYRPIIQSDNGVFVLAFVPSAGQSWAMDLAVVMQQQVLNETGAVVVNSLYRGVESLELDSGSLSINLQASLSIYVGDVGAMELLNSGNLIFYNDTHGIAWDSLDHPHDILLPGQQIGVGAQLLSPEYDYTASLGNEGLAFHLVGFNTYFTWATKECNGQQPTLKLESSKLSLCDNVSLHIEGADLAFIQLTSKGDIVDFHFDSSSLLWVQGNFSLVTSQTKTLCTLPQWCEDGGFCGGAGNCTCTLVPECPYEYRLTSADGCMEHWMWATTHFSIFGKQPDFLRTAQDECMTLCSCSTCSAAFYNATDGSCYHVRGRLVGSFSWSHGMVAVAFNPEPNMLNKRPASPHIVIIILMLAYIGPPYGCIFCGRQLDRLAEKMAQFFRKLLKDPLRRLFLQEEAKELERVLGDAKGHLPQRFKYASLKAATVNFSDARKLGAGGFGAVYEAVMDDGQRLAVKELGGGNRQGQGLKAFVSEIASMASISHINVLRLHGFCIDTVHRLLVYDYMPNSSLDRWLFKRTAERCLSWKQRQDIALGVASGLAYLHGECREPILHLDVKPQNILLDDRLVAKVADFGMAKLLVDRDASKVETNVRGTPGYIAPEWLLHSIATKKCDVYSYGMVLLELTSGRKNLDLTMAASSSSSSSSDDNDDNSSWYFPAWAAKQVQKGRMMRLVDERIADSVTEQELRRMIWLAFWCIQERASLRPAMQEVVLVLGGLQEVKEPPMSFHFAVQGATSLDCGEGWFTAAQEVEDKEAMFLMQELAVA